MKQYNLVPATGRWCCAAGKVTGGLAESNDSLPPGGWLIVTCGLTACTPGSSLGPTLGNEYGKPLSFLRWSYSKPKQCCSLGHLVVIMSAVQSQYQPLHCFCIWQYSVGWCWQGLELHPSCAGLQVSAFMLTPVQRMPRYVLLLKVSSMEVLYVL